MPKMKTRKGAAKRFKVTGSGRIKRNKATIGICLYVIEQSKAKNETVHSSC